MENLGLHDVTRMTPSDVVSLAAIAALTGFPVDFIRGELFLEGEDLEEITMTELRKKVLAYLDASFLST